MDNIKTFLFALILAIIVCLGIPLGFWAGNTFDGIRASGAYTPWELLDSPVAFTRIADVSSRGIWAQTKDDKLYFWKFCGNQGSMPCEWTEITNIPSNAHVDDFSPMSKGKNCPESHTYPKNYPGNIIECATMPLRSGSGFANSYFTLLEDGTIWEWDHPPLPDTFGYGVLIGTPLGFLLSIIIGVIALRVLEKED